MDTDSLSNDLLDVFQRAELFQSLEYVLESIHNPEIVRVALRITATMASSPSHPMVLEACTKQIHDLLLSIANDPGSTQQPEVRMKLPKLSLAGLFGQNDRIPTKTYDDLRLFALGALQNLFTASVPLCRESFADGGFFNTCSLLFQQSTPHSQIAILTSFARQIETLPDPVPSVALHPYVNLFAAALEKELDPLFVPIYCLVLCIDRSRDIGDYLIPSQCFAIVCGLISAVTIPVQVQALAFVSRVLCSCSDAAKGRLLEFVNWENWRNVGLSDEIAVIDPWATFTAEIILANPSLVGPLAGAGVIAQLTQCATQGSFNMRKATIVNFLRCAEALPFSVLEPIVRDGFVTEIADFLGELEDEDALRHIRFVSVVLASALEPEFTQKTRASLLASSFAEAVERMMDSDHEELMRTALDFKDAFITFSESDPLN
jgi:hypothetical protein